MTGPVDIRVRLDAGTFRRFCAFDALRRQRRWYWPALISMLLITASLAGLFGWLAMSEAVSGLLMGLGLAVPMVNLGLYLIPIEVQIARQHLKDAPLVYALRITEDGARITNGQREEMPVDVSWSGFWAAFRHGGDIYLYVNPERALILPQGQASVPTEALWAFLQAHLGAKKCFGDRRRTAGRAAK